MVSRTKVQYEEAGTFSFYTDSAPPSRFTKLGENSCHGGGVIGGAEREEESESRTSWAIRG